MPSPARPETIDPQTVEHEDLEAVASLLQANGQKATTLRGPNGEAMLLPASAFNALKLIVQWMSEGRTINLIPSGSSITTQQAANILGVSRPHVVRLLDAGEMSFDKPGSHRRIPIEEVIAYQERRKALRRAGLRLIGDISSEATDTP